MREARITTHSREDVDVAGAAPVRKGFVARLLGCLLDWRRREANRTIGRYAYMLGEAADLYRVYEADVARRQPHSAFDRTDALRRGIALHDYA
jgi:hypothetical protein